jgi:hypothetical protein
MAQTPVVDRIRLIPRPADFLGRNVGASGEVFFNTATNSLRVYSGKDRGGFEIARSDLSNVSNSAFAAKATAAGIGGGGSTPETGTSISVSTTAPVTPGNGNLWLNTNNGYLYVYVNDGSSSQWIQPAIPTPSLPSLSAVALSGSYNDLLDKPVLSEDGQFSGSYDDLTDKPILFSGSYDDLTDTPILFSGSYVDLTNKPTTFSDLTLTGLTTLQQSAEIFDTKTGATGVVVHDFSTGAIWYHTSITANFTANFTNVPTTANRAITVVLVLNQGSTARLPSAIQVNGAGVTIEWQEATPPTPNSNQIDVVSFTLLRVGSTWFALGSLTTYA